MSSVGNDVSTSRRDACDSVRFLLVPAVVGSSGSSCLTGSAVVCGWLRPNPSAFRPSRSTLDSSVTSSAPLSAVVVVSTADGVTVAVPSLVVNGTSNLSPVQPTWCCTSECRPSCAGAVTTSPAPPVAVSNCHTPAPVFVFSLLPTVSMMYGPPNGSEPPNSWYVL